MTVVGPTLADLAPLPPAVWLALAAAVGLVFGSFVTALSYRVPRRQGFIAARSRCPACGGALAPRDLVPLLSWVLNRGRCRQCGAAVSIRYPLIELVAALLFVSAVWHEQRLVPLALLFALATLILTLTVTDLETRRMPLPLLAALALAGAAWRALVHGDLWAGAQVAAVVLAVGLAAALASRAWARAPRVGMADAYALACVALALPWLPFVAVMGLAGLAGLIFGLLWRAVRGEAAFPFAPALFAAFWPMLIRPEAVLAPLIGFAAQPL